ncbi:unnamed protein product [Penicillium glandicola]
MGVGVPNGCGTHKRVAHPAPLEIFELGNLNCDDDDIGRIAMGLTIKELAAISGGRVFKKEITRSISILLLTRNMAAPPVLAIYIFWKVFTKQWRMRVPLKEIDLQAGLRTELLSGNKDLETLGTWQNFPMRLVRLLIKVAYLT